MNFYKDLLLVDLETTGLDSFRQEIIQLSAVLLDKKTLKEKAVFNAYAKPVKWHTRDRESMRINGIKKEWLNAAPPLKDVLKEFNKKFNPQQVILSYYGGPVDTDFMRAAYKTAGIKWQFDYHYFNLWAYFYAHLALKNQLKNKKKFTGFSLEDLMRKFKISAQGGSASGGKSFGSRHDGLTDCRIEAEILRKIVK